MYGNILRAESGWDPAEIGDLLEDRFYNKIFKVVRPAFVENYKALNLNKLHVGMLQYIDSHFATFFHSRFSSFLPKHGSQAEVLRGGWGTHTYISSTIIEHHNLYVFEIGELENLVSFVSRN